MTTPEHGTEPTAPPATPAPTTGHPAIDAALAEFGKLSQHPNDQHHARLSQVSDVLAAVLEDRGAPGQHQPGQPGQPGQPSPGPRPSAPRR
ncbi:hypothetical protein ACPCG0_00035 [Propionibacteriaceae bacterium Y1923]|uniref:hypothetical protein n=1 Tax=Aestuariimicrobium sp. Y1814 TaxID=3418742 RepID=UPI003C1869C3